VPPAARESLKHWLSLRPESHTDAVFISPDNASEKRGGGELTGDGLYQMIKRITTRAGCETRVYGIRDTAVTQALTNTNGDVASVSKFSPHRDIGVVMTYADRLEDAAGDIAWGVHGVI
jgi:integrase